MSTRGLRGYERNSRRRTMVLDVDLNVPLREIRNEEGTSASVGSLDPQAAQQRVSVPPACVDVEAVDDDVMISSPRSFAQAKSNSRRNYGRNVVVDVDSEEWTSRFTLNGRNKRRRVSLNQPIVNSDLYINLEANNYSMRENVQSMAPPKEPTFNCPVCMGPLVEAMSTKCGHIFCKACIKASIAAQSKCPTCRRKITMRNTIRIYLPATS